MVDILKIKRVVAMGLLLMTVLYSTGQEASSKIKINISVSEDLKSSFKSEGRLLIFLNENPNVEPRNQSWPSKGNFIFAKNILDWNPKKNKVIESSNGWSKISDWGFQNIPDDVYYIQVLWDQDLESAGIKSAGNLYSTKQKISVNESTTVEIKIDQEIKPLKIEESEMVKFVNFKSDTLSKWWERPMYLKASILLPRGYNEKLKKAYPIRYNIAGYGGRFTRINRAVKNGEFMKWWMSEDAPEVINVFLDGDSPYGDSYHLDSDNSGPYGYSLINELIPFIETKYRGSSSTKTRFVDGCSTGGWVSLGLQLYYPDTFNGVFSYSPDAVEFENYQLINIYKDKNAFVNEFGYLRPVMRMTDGEPSMSLKDFIKYENIIGSSNTYLDSGGQFSAHSALYSEKGTNGLPKPLFNPETGEVDASVAQSWKKYDFKLYAKKNWNELGPKLQGKIFIWMGDMDHFYLNMATRSFSEFLNTTTEPKSDAEIVFESTKGHCAGFSNRVILEKIGERLKEINVENDSY